MNASHVATVAVLVAAGLWAPVAWSAPHKATATHAYVVKAGDGGWWAIAHAHGMTMEQVLAANHANAGTPVRAGQTIQLPAAPRDPAKHAKTTAAAPKKAARPTPPAPTKPR